MTPRFRVSFPQVFTSKLNELNGKQEYSIVALFDKTSDLSKLKKAVEDVIAEKWPNPKTRPSNIRTPFRDQGERAKEIEGKEVLPSGYTKGAVFCTFKSQQKPGVINQRKETIIDSADFYAGCYAIATVRPYAYDNKGNRGVAFGLGNIMKMAEGDPLTGRSTPEESFAGVVVNEGDTTDQMFS